jgi:ribonuclease E
MAFVRDIMPTRAKTLRLDDGERPLFSKFNLEEQIESIYKRRVPLPSGGEIVIDGTEALTAIDVNSARSRRQGEADEIAVQTNLEAAAEIGRQLRLRDLGGLIVIDFIDMAASRNTKKVEKAMRDGLRGDKAKHDATSISKLGLMEISRQRIKGAKMGDMYATCPTCEGYGLVKNVEAAALSALRKLQTRSSRGDFGRVRLSLPPEVATWILNYKRDDLQQTERRHQARIDIVPNPKLLRHQAEIETIPRDKVEEATPPPTLVGDRVVPLPPTDQELAASVKAGVESVNPLPSDTPPVQGAQGAQGITRGVAGTEGEAQPRRRRRRRRGRGGGAAIEASATALSAATNGSGPPVERPTPSLRTDEADAAEGEIAGPSPTEPAGGEGGSPGESLERRSRRRRRRRGRGSATPEAVRDPNLAPGGATRPAAPKVAEEQETYVPPGVRSDELMPAATGSRPRAKGPGRGGPRRRGGRSGSFEGGEG